MCVCVRAQYCNYDDVVGAFRDCGPSGAVINQWADFDSVSSRTASFFVLNGTASVERGALVDLYTSTGGTAAWRTALSVGWSSMSTGVDPCASGAVWAGVGCSAGNPSHVVYVGGG